MPTDKPVGIRRSLTSTVFGSGHKPGLSACSVVIDQGGIHCRFLQPCPCVEMVWVFVHFSCAKTRFAGIGNGYLLFAGRHHCLPAFYMSQLVMDPGNLKGVRTVSRRRQARPANLTLQEAEQYRNMIQKWARQAPQEQTDSGEKERSYPAFTLSSGLGRAVYASYSDEELLDILRGTALQIERAPTQRDVFSLYRIYLKARFGTWPAALKAAGMRQLPVPDLRMPDWAQMLAEEPETCAALEDVAHHRRRLGYPPRKRDVPQAKILCERFRSWENVIAAAESLEKWQEERRNSDHK